MRTFSARARRRRVAVAALVATLACGVLAASAAEVTVDPPAGFVVAPTEPGSDGVSIVEVKRPGDDAGCEVAFRAVKPSAARSQAAINAEAARPDYLDGIKAQDGGKFDKADIGPFTAGGVQGAAILGEPAGSDGAVKALLVILDTPEGRTLVSCSAAAPAFDALLPAFEAVARGVKPPKA